MIPTLALAALLAAGPADAAALAAAIDRHVGPAAVPRCDDATFFRRLHLALAGRIPTAAEARLFLADADPSKRAKAVDRLLDSPAHANHLTAAWRGWLMPEAASNDQAAAGAPALEAWLRPRLRDNLPLDRLATALLTAPLDGRGTADDAAGPVAYYAAKEGKPENLAAGTARVFLGVQLECAQCHDHPFGKWSRDQFWGLAAFFGGIERGDGGLREVMGRRELLLPNSDRAVPATLLDDREPEWRFKQSPRATLAAWLTRPDNPFFARAAANRLWAVAFGVGLVDPIDDWHDGNPASHPPLHDELARALVESRFDARHVLRAICLSETFQRASAAGDARTFAAFPVQGLTPESLFDSVAVALGRPRNVGEDRRAQLEPFALAGRRTDAPTTIVQALTLMNGSATDPANSPTLTAATTLPGLTPAERIEALYFAALGRPPRPAERQRALAHVTANEPARYADVFWALLNGLEFRTNH